MNKPPLINQIVNGMLGSVRPSDYFNALPILFSELNAASHILQRNGQTVRQHTMAVLDLLQIKNPITLIAGLLHDLGKCVIPPMDDPSMPRFPGHAMESAIIADRKLLEWGATSYLKDRAIRIIETHMFDISQSISEKTMRKFVADVHRDNIDNWFALRIADSRSYKYQHQYYSHFIEPFRIAVVKYLEQLPNDKTMPQYKCDYGMQIEGSDSE